MTRRFTPVRQHDTVIPVCRFHVKPFFLPNDISTPIVRDDLS